MSKIMLPFRSLLATVELIQSNVKDNAAFRSLMATVALIQSNVKDNAAFQIFDGNCRVDTEQCQRLC